MYRVLLVDDEPFILQGLTDFIPWNEHGLEIAAIASNGHDALNIINTTTIHILITDIRMPKMDGIELIRQIRALEKNIKCIILSGYNDFEFVKEAAKLGIENYLLKPVDESELILTVDNTVSKIENELYKKLEIQEGFRILRDNILNRWVAGEIRGSELRDKLRFLNMEFDHDEYLVCLTKILPNLLCNDQLKNDHALLRFAVNNICSQLVSENNLGLTFFDLSGGIVFLLTGSQLEKNRKKIQQVLYECIHQVNILLKTDLFISVGNPEKDPMSLHRSYNQALRLQDYRLVLGCNKILWPEADADRSQRGANILPYLTNLNAGLKTKNLIQVLQAIDDIFTYLHTLNYLSPELVQNIAVSVLLEIIHTIRILNLNTSDVFEDITHVLSKVFEFSTLIALQEWLKKTAVICLEILIKQDQKVSPLVKKVADYIDCNYMNNINLKTVAGEFSLNAFYLGQLFNKEIGEHFTSYINRIRIDKSKELLRDTGITTNEIASRVGYSNTNYFFTIFRKYSGMSPAEFRHGKGGG